MNPIQRFQVKKNPHLWRMASGLRAEPARQAKRKEADATGPQGGYGIRLACPWLRAKEMPKECEAYIFLYILSGKFFYLQYISLIQLLIIFKKIDRSPKNCERQAAAG